jgi:DNA-binding NarL/FixJ family response regulator
VEEKNNTVRSAVVVDRHPLWIDAVEHVLSAADVEVVARVATLEDAQEPLDRLRPDLVVAEIAIGGSKADGLAWLQRTAEHFEAKIIVLTSCAEAEYINAALDHSIYLRNMLAPQPTPLAVAPVETHDLTQRELEILGLVAEGYSNANLAKMLWVTEQTVKFHLSNIYRKLDVSNRTEASRWAQLHGLLSSGSNAGRVG